MATLVTETCSSHGKPWTLVVPCCLTMKTNLNLLQASIANTVNPWAIDPAQVLSGVYLSFEFHVLCSTRILFPPLIFMLHWSLYVQ